MYLADDGRGRKVLEVRTLTDEERIQQLENELEVTILFGEEADRKYEEVCVGARIIRWKFSPYSRNFVKHITDIFKTFISP